MIKSLRDKVLAGGDISREEALALSECDITELCGAANEIRAAMCGASFDLCCIVNGKSGRCSEDCKYCAQSAHHRADTESYPLLSREELLKDADANEKSGILRYSVVTSGRTLDSEELESVCESYSSISERCKISLCASHGLLTLPQLQKLRAAGVSRYHCNLETSRGYFHNVCTTHTFEDKLSTIRAAREAGLSVCSGGIVGLGESMGDRIDMALELRALGVKSVPINILNSIPGTPLEHLPVLSPDEARRIVAVFRFILPTSALRMAGGRGLLPDRGRALILSGTNAAISGDMLTTSGTSTETDIKMITELGYRVERL